MPTVIKAAFVGDSHGMIVQSAAAENGITFQAPITAASAIFAQAKFVREEGDTAADFQMAADRVDLERHSAAKVKHRINKAKAMTAAFQAVFEDPLPVFMNIGTSARPFALKMAAASKNAPMSRKLMKIAAQEYFADFRAQYAQIVTHCPEVICFYSPTRFTAETRDIWLAYDDMVAAEMGDLGVEMLDLRAELGDDDLLLREEFYPTPEDDGVHAGHAWGMAVTEAIQRRLKTGA